MALISASCHYGGNIIHTIAIPQVSAAIAWPMGQAANIWSYIWGVLYGEFKGSSKKTYIILLSGILLFVVGVILLSINIYW
jgi:glucose uptake protein GlcU